MSINGVVLNQSFTNRNPQNMFTVREDDVSQKEKVGGGGQGDKSAREARGKCARHALAPQIRVVASLSFNLMSFFARYARSLTTN